MRSKITERLFQIEREQQIKILYACESGSRAWGFPSPDSDYDVRFIYIRPAEDYLTIQRKRDQLVFPVNEDLDISGWDLGKTLQLITKSNSSAFEWLQSPVAYKGEESFRTDMWLVCRSYFCARTNVHHYLGIAKGAMNSTTDGEVPIKKLFYILRPLLSALWCIDRKCIAPMNINPLMELFPDKLKNKIQALIDLKSASGERFTIKIDNDLRLWIEETFEYCSRQSDLLTKKHFEISKADDFFKATLKL